MTVMTQKNIELLLISSLLHDDDKDIIFSSIQENFFKTNLFKNLFSFIKTSYSSNRTPNIELFLVKEGVPSEKIEEIISFSHEYKTIEVIEFFIEVHKQNTVDSKLKEMKESSTTEEKLKLMSEIQEEVNISVGKSKLKDGKTSISNYKEYLEKAQASYENSDGVMGISTGIPSLNEKVIGLKNSEYVIVAARPSMGKCLGKGTKVLMFDGSFKKVEEITEGDLLMGDDSTPRKVLSTTSGTENMYLIKQENGISYRVNESHILSLKKGRIENDLFIYGDETINLEILDYVKHPEKAVLRGYKVPVFFTHSEKVIDPEIYVKDIEEDIGISEEYKINSYEIRMKLFLELVRLKAEIKDTSYKFKYEVEKFANDLKFIADSLGYGTKINKRHKFLEVFFKNNNTESDLIQTEIEVILEKQDEYFGFELDGNKLFLLEDMTVTHNTSLTTGFFIEAIADKNVEGVPVMFSLEMENEQIMGRMIAQINDDLDLRQTIFGKDKDISEYSINSAIEFLEQKDFYIEDFADDDGNQKLSITPLDLLNKLREIKAKHGKISLIIIDYIQLMSPSNPKLLSPNERVSSISSEIKSLGRQFGCPVVALSQLNRDLEKRQDKRPQLSDLRDSGSLEQDADIIMFVYRPEVYLIKELQEKMKAKPNDIQLERQFRLFTQREFSEAEIIIGKQRNGPIGIANTYFKKKNAKFGDVYDESVLNIEEIYGPSELYDNE